MKQLENKIKEQTAQQQKENNGNSRIEVIALNRDGFETIYQQNGGDPYELIKEARTKTPNQQTPFAIMLTCSGWAVAIEGDQMPTTQPSKHPKRKRVHLTVGIMTTGNISAIAFDQDPMQTISTEGQGELEQKLDNALRYLQKKNKTHINRTEPTI